MQEYFPTRCVGQNVDADCWTRLLGVMSSQRRLTTKHGRTTTMGDHSMNKHDRMYRRIHRSTVQGIIITVAMVVIMLVW